VRIGIGLLVAVLAVGATHAALGGGMTATPAPLLTFVPPGGGICAVWPDGSHGRRLTPPWRLSDVSWSPDGRHVAFVRATSAGNMPSKVSVADARGRIRWRFGAGHAFSPLWAPDGQHIAFLFWWAHSAGLVVARPEGSDLHRVADSGWPPHSGPHNPAWSADGQRIAFDYDDSIYSVRIDGSDRQLLLANAALPAYSPDGTKLAYVSRTGPGVFVANTDGSHPHEVSSRTIRWDGWAPSWSPDGSLLAFAALASPEVVVAKADGSGERVIADLGARWVRSAPQWSPDGALVAFTQAPAEYRPFRSSIVVARADGRGWRIIVKNRRPGGISTRLPGGQSLPCPRRSVLRVDGTDPSTI
jgi:Tol biopolymer transport system component